MPVIHPSSKSQDTKLRREVRAGNMNGWSSARGSFSKAMGEDHYS